jgi:hypothetical protein
MSAASLRLSSVVLALFAAIQASAILIGLGHPIDVPRIVAILQG